MDTRQLLERYGLWDAKVPRYTSYPPANRFESEIGQTYQASWLDRVPEGAPVSLYVHIPFCKRLCWFCACRTQGTQTLRPIEDYLNDVLREIDAVAERLPFRTPMARLHLGGGTPTLLSARLMDRLLDAIYKRFPTADDFEFSVEIDPTEAAEPLLNCLADWSMNRASIGVQDFALDVQRAIGREQSFDQTRRVADRLRAAGVKSLNLDLLYGLPYQTEKTLTDTLSQVERLNPDRLALYGYAHVPHMSKRQVMIESDLVPGPRTRLRLFELAKAHLTGAKYLHLGIDHFAKPADSLARAAAQRKMRRNFQGHTDDPCETLIGFGASAISRYRQGYAQNAVATAAYRGRVSATGFAAHKGYLMSSEEHALADLIEELMCYSNVDLDPLLQRHPHQKALIMSRVEAAVTAFPGAVSHEGGTLHIPPFAQPLTRIIAAFIDGELPEPGRHSLAI